MLNWTQRVVLLKACGTIFLIAFFMPFFAHGQTIPSVYTNQNFLMSTHDTPKSFTQARDGSFRGITQTGKVFVQYPILLDPMIRLHRFEIDEAFFYISNRGIIFANSDLVALSIYSARV